MLRIALTLSLVVLVACKQERQPPAERAPEPEDVAAPTKERPAEVAPEPAREPEPDALVDVTELAPDIRLDIRYATDDNFTGKAVYPAARCLLRYEVARRLAAVQRELEEQDLGLLIWDCYRPFSVQKKLWEITPDPRYVARPVESEDGGFAKGSKHNRGAAVDLTLVDRAGKRLEMPTDYDDFSKKAHRSYGGSSNEARRNMNKLESAMAEQGFEPLPTEWWHFDGPGWQRYPISDRSLEPR